MADEKIVLRPGEILIAIRISPPILAGQKEQFNMNVEGTENPFVIRRILRHAEESVVAQIEQAVVASAMQNQRIERVN